MAAMYFFGLFVTLLIACFQRSKWWLYIIGLIFACLILATTSIKTNLGVFLGAVSAFVVYFGFFRRAFARNLVPLIALIGLLGISVASNDALVKSLQRGVDRVELGIDVLQAREDTRGFYGFEMRRDWAVDGLKGWTQNPVFGYGVEAFRSRFGATSHSTPIDLLYNSGLIGLVLYYSVFLSIFWRLRSARDASLTPIRAIIFGCLVCLLFITMSGTVHYHHFWAACFAISVGVLRRYERQNSPMQFPGQRLNEKTDSLLAKSPSGRLSRQEAHN
jgi:O-antigen ligase